MVCEYVLVPNSYFTYFGVLISLPLTFTFATNIHVFLVFICWSFTVSPNGQLRHGTNKGGEIEKEKEKWQVVVAEMGLQERMEMVVVGGGGKN